MDNQNKQNSMIILTILIIVVLISIVLIVASTKNTNTNNPNSLSSSISSADHMISSGSSILSGDHMISSNSLSQGKVDISISNFNFPAQVNVSKGQEVVWTNNDSVNHTVTFQDGSVTSGNIAPGGTFTYKFNSLGDFTYSCSIHPNMIGKITVK